MTKDQSLNIQVVKIRPSWELVNEDEKSKWTFEFTDIPKRYKPARVRNAWNKKIIKEMEARMKL